LVPVNTFTSPFPTGDFDDWFVFTYSVRLISAVTKRRTYSVIPQNIYVKSIPTTPFVSCTSELLFCLSGMTLQVGYLVVVVLFLSMLF
jgi:hypothetical protein